MFKSTQIKRGRTALAATSKILGYIAMVAMLPVAAESLLATPNKYRAMGVDAIDCDGPISVLIFAVPALTVYAIASLIFLRSFRRLGSLVPGIICGLICVGLIWNISNAAEEQWKNSAGQDCDAGL